MNKDFTRTDILNTRTDWILFSSERKKMEDECEHVLNHICIADQDLKNNPPFEFSLWLLLCWTF